MSMNQAEREIIEYRPQIGLDRMIFARIIKEANQPQGIQYEATTSLVQRTKTLKADIVESLATTMNNASWLMDQLKEGLRADPSFVAYTQATTDLEREAIYEDHLDNIESSPDFDLYPILADIQDEMQDYMEFIDDFLYEGELDATKLEEAREAEEKVLEHYLQMESEDLSFQTTPSFTPQQLALIQRTINDPDTSLSSIEDYIEELRREQLTNGSPRVPYQKIFDETRLIHILHKKSDMFKEQVNHLIDLHQTKLSSYAHDEIAGSLEYVVDKSNMINDLSDISQMAYSYHTSDMKNFLYQLNRVGDQDLRHYMDQKLKEVYAKKQRYVNQLGEHGLHETTVENPGATGVIWAMKDGINAVYNAWMFLMTEHLGTTEENIFRWREFSEKWNEKRKQQIMYRYLKKVSNEFEFNRSDQTAARQNFLGTLRTDPYLQ